MGQQGAPFEADSKSMRCIVDDFQSMLIGYFFDADYIAWIPVDMCGKDRRSSGRYRFLYFFWVDTECYRVYKALRLF